MRLYVFLSLAALVAAAITFAAGPAFVPLFDGKDLTAFQPTPGPWKVADGVLSLVGRTDEQMQNKNYLWTSKMYGNFVLDLEFKVPERANSGVFIRTSDLKDPVQTGIEIQVTSGHPDGSVDRGTVGSIYDLVVPKGNAYKAGQWNHYVITCLGPNIKVELNGQTVSEANLDRWSTAHRNPDGSENKFNRPLRAFARKGYIGFQDHGTPVSYRNIRIQVLDK
jgi:hypothetical protein